MKPKKYEILPTAKFWMWHHQGWVKIRLRPGQTLQHGWIKPTDEGYSSGEQRFRYNQFNLTVERNGTDGGCDCDGPIERNWSAECHIDGLHQNQSCWTGEFGDRDHNLHPLTIPDWRNLGSRVKDTYAQAANY